MHLSRPRVIIIGAGFGGLNVAKNLRNTKYEVILIDKSNHHLFQPLLYQVATSALSPGDIAIPIRTILRKASNIQVIMNEALSIDLQNKVVHLTDGNLYYDYLVLSPGSHHSYFGNEHWECFAPGLKSLSDALRIRERILSSFEIAERVYGTSEMYRYLTFVIVGGGPTGVELAGAIAEIGKKTMLADFPILRDEDIRVILIEAGDKLLASYTDNLSQYTENALKKLGVEILFNEKVIDIYQSKVITNKREIISNNIIWAAGNSASKLISTLGVEVDRYGRAIVKSDLSIPGHPEVFVIGDAALVKNENSEPLPAIAPVAIQQGRYVANIIKSKIPTYNRPPFRYKDKGMMATIGRAKAVAIINKFKISGFFAWLLWSFVHIFFLIDFRNRFKVMLEWIWYYITYKPGARLIIYSEQIPKEKKYQDKDIEVVD